ncbi:MAG: ATP-binding protein [Oscillospiraceae bacterium]|nr:ATP-binding protein [Oscillospiraceae bacterium]
MAYDEKILRVSMGRFQADKERRAAAFAQRQEQIFREIPRLEEIDRELRSTMAQIVSSALRRGTDPLPALRVIRDRNLELQRERASLLMQRGYEADELEEKPQCVLCQDRGFVNGAMCRCLKKYYTRAQIEELSSMLDMGNASFESFNFEWYSRAPWKDYGISPYKNMEKVFDTCRDYAMQFSQNSGNLLLFGPSGLGKTFLSACIARVVSEKGFSVVYDTAGHVFSQFEKVKFRREEDEAAEQHVDRCTRCDLLIVDDLGTEMTTSFVQSALYQIMNDRLTAKLPTIISTNLNPGEIGKRYSPQIQSRLEGEFEGLSFFGEDIRLKKRQQQK